MKEKSRGEFLFPVCVPDICSVRNVFDPYYDPLFEVETE